MASILVCEKCKKVSCTYEDFDDLSLPIKAEEYERVRRRDRLKSFAKKLRIGGLDLSANQPRSSSTPASPTRKGVDPEKIFERTSISKDRRRSLDAESVVSALDKDTLASMTPPVVIVNPEVPTDKSQSSGDSADAKPQGYLKAVKQDEEEGWGKLSRHISMRLGRKGRGKEARKGKGKEEEEPSTHDLGSAKLHSKARVVSSDALLSTASSTSTSIDETQPSSSSSAALSVPPLPTILFPPRPSIARSHSASPRMSSTNILADAHPPPPVPSTSPETDRRTPSPLPRSNSPQPQNLTRQETEYLRRLLTDVPSSTAVLPLSNIFRAASGTSSTEIGGGNANWPKFGGVQSVEDCLRMFTAVEVLDGENKYGCRRCWKMANGQYTGRGRAVSKRFSGDKPDGEEEGSSSSDEDDDEQEPVDAGVTKGNLKILSTQSLMVDSPALAPTTPSASPLASSLSLTETPSVKPARTTFQSTAEVGVDDSSRKVSTHNPFRKTQIDQHNPLHSDNLKAAVPVISIASEVDTPTVSSITEQEHRATNAHTIPILQDDTSTPLARPLTSSPSRDSLKLPDLNSQHQHIRHSAATSIVRGLSGDSSNASSEDSDTELLESDADLSTSVQSDTSSLASRDEKMPVPEVAKPNSESPPPTISVESPDPKVHLKRRPSKATRSKQVIPRRHYKRYLVAKPPPVLVVHLKRFQQVGKQTMYSTFSNLKKLDDNVAFPEYLDLTPFLVPRKEDFGLGTTSEKHDPKAPIPKPQKCVYRLFAVVVHIGNMVRFLSECRVIKFSNSPPYSSADTTSLIRLYPTLR